MAVRAWAGRIRVQIIVRDLLWVTEYLKQFCLVENILNLLGDWICVFLSWDCLLNPSLILKIPQGTRIVAESSSSRRVASCQPFYSACQRVIGV
jgi:hypothetical protein